jgi:hypothetical protein
MEKPTIITIENGLGEVVYMRFIDGAKTQIYIDGLDELAEEYVEIIDKSTGDTFYGMSEFVQNLLRGKSKDER